MLSIFVQGTNGLYCFFCFFDTAPLSSNWNTDTFNKNKTIIKEMKGSGRKKRLQLILRAAMFIMKQETAVFFLCSSSLDGLVSPYYCSFLIALFFYPLFLIDLCLKKSQTVPIAANITLETSVKYILQFITAQKHHH